MIMDPLKKRVTKLSLNDALYYKKRYTDELKRNARLRDQVKELTEDKDKLQKQLDQDKELNN